MNFEQHWCQLSFLIVERHLFLCHIKPLGSFDLSKDFIDAESKVSTDLDIHERDDGYSSDCE